MKINEVKAVHDAQPFRPLRLHLADGGTLTVRHREFLAISPVGRTVVVFGEDGEMSIIDLLPVSRIEIINGSSGRRRRR